VASEATRERLLDAAEELFSVNGFAATSVRAITRQAGVHLAAMNYHYGSKDALIQAVFERRVGPLNRERIRLLDDAEATAGGQGPSLETILAALLGPAFRLAGNPEGGGREFMRLMGRVHSESGDLFQKLIVPLFRLVFIRFEKALALAVPSSSGGSAGRSVLAHSLRHWSHGPHHSTCLQDLPPAHHGRIRFESCRCCTRRGTCN